MAVVFPVFNIAIGTYFDPINKFNMIKQEPILQEKKDKYNSLGFYYYCNEPEHIVIDHRNCILLVTKKQVLGTFTGNLMALVSYKSPSVKEKEISLD